LTILLLINGANHTGLSDYSIEIIVNSMQKRKNDLHKKNILIILDIFSKITQKKSTADGNSCA